MFLLPYDNFEELPDNLEPYHRAKKNPGEISPGL